VFIKNGWLKIQKVFPFVEFFCIRDTAPWLRKLDEKQKKKNNGTQRVREIRRAGRRSEKEERTTVKGEDKV
jgi:hypothetical protein